MNIIQKNKQEIQQQPGENPDEKPGTEKRQPHIKRGKEDRQEEVGKETEQKELRSIKWPTSLG